MCACHMFTTGMQNIAPEASIQVSREGIFMNLMSEPRNANYLKRFLSASVLLLFNSDASHTGGDIALLLLYSCGEE